jgi:hypothetical protein
LYNFEMIGKVFPSNDEELIVFNTFELSVELLLCAFFMWLSRPDFVKYLKGQYLQSNVEGFVRCRLLALVRSGFIAAAIALSEEFPSHEGVVIFMIFGLSDKLLLCWF